MSLLLCQFSALRPDYTCNLVQSSTAEKISEASLVGIQYVFGMFLALGSSCVTATIACGHPRFQLVAPCL